MCPHESNFLKNQHLAIRSGSGRPRLEQYEDAWNDFDSANVDDRNNRTLARTLLPSMTSRAKSIPIRPTGQHSTFVHRHSRSKSSNFQSLVHWTNTLISGPPN